MTGSPHVVDVDEAGFQAAVLDQSRRIPVLVDFWAEWCGPCRALAPILARLADDFAGRFILAKVDTEACPSLAASLGIRSLPTMRLFRDARVVEELVGLQPEQAIRELIERHVAGGTAEVRERAAELSRRGDVAEARTMLEAALGVSPADPGLICDLALLLIGAGELDAAESRLEALSAGASMAPEAKRAVAALHFGRLAENRPPTDVLARTVEGDPGDLEARIALGARRMIEGDPEGALEAFLEVLRRDRRYDDDGGRRCMLAAFELLGDDDPLVPRYRSLMARALY